MSLLLSKKVKMPKILLSASTRPYKEFPGGLLVRIPCFHCRGLGSIPGLGTEILETRWGMPPPPTTKKTPKTKTKTKNKKDQGLIYV